MSKITIAGLYVLGVLLEPVGGVVFLANSEINPDQAGMILGIMIMVLGGILGMIAWIGALVNLSRAQLWTWFVLMFFFGGIMLLIYLIGGPQPLKAGQTPQAQRVLTYPPSTYLPGIPSQLPLAQAYPPSHTASALEILQQRYAHGEIDTATFDRMRARLEASERPLQ